MKIGITGGKGFIGGSVAKHLLRNGHEIVNLDIHTRHRSSKKYQLKELENFNWVLHFGASTSIKKSYDDPFSTYQNNLGSTLIALDIARSTGAAFMYMSSYVYGPPQYLPLDEKHPVCAVNPYMSSKVLGENICLHLSQHFELDLIIFRGFNVYGNNIKKGMLIPDLIKSVKNSDQLIVNDPNPIRDYLYIEDFCDLILKMVASSPIPTGTYNVGYGRSYSNLEVAETIHRIAKSPLPIEIRSRPRLNDINDCSVDVALIRKTFSWSPRYSLSQGIKMILSE